MTTVGRRTESELDRPSPTPTQANRGLRWVYGILAVLVIAVGAWLIVGVVAGGDDLPGDVQTALEDYESAWTTTSEAAFLAATTADYSYVNNNGTEFDVETQAFNVGVMSYWKVELSDETVEGSGPYIITRSEVVYPSALASGTAGQSVLTVTEVDGTWKVSRHTWTETG